MKVFEGKQFLKDNGVTMKLSNGKEFKVEELPQGILTELSELPDDATDIQIVEMLAKFMSVEPEMLEGIGLIETKGALDFLADNLLASKSPKKTTLG